MEAQWQSLLRSRLRDKQVADALATNCVKAVSEPKGDDNDEPEVAEAKSVTACLEKACADNEQLPADQVAQLRLVSNVFRTSKADLKLTKDLLEAFDAAAGPQTTSQVVCAYYSQLATATDKTIRVTLFEKEPTAVVAGLIKSERLHVCDVEDKSDEVPYSPDFQQLVAKLFSIIVNQGLDISKNSIAQLPDECSSTNSDSTVNHPRPKAVVAAIQRLRAVVTDPLDLPALLNRRFVSAHGIASLDRTDFITTVAKTSSSEYSPIDEASALAIWYQAGVINLRNERVWSDLVRQRLDIPVLAFDQAEDVDIDDDAVVSFVNLFKENDSLESDEMSSVLSPAAYLVDLLQLLRYSYFDPSASPDPQHPSELLTTLLNRRPDLVKLELSKENTTSLVSYNDLINEILESYIATNAKLPGHESSTAPTLHGTDWSVYEQVIQNQKYPAQQFPFNITQNASRHYLQALGTSLYDLYYYFNPQEAPGNGFMRIDSPTAETLQKRKALIQSASERRLAAEYLDISHENYVAITGEAFQSPTFVSEMQDHRAVFSRESYNTIINLASTGEYWGYTTDDDGTANEKMVGMVLGYNGLRSVKFDVLPRSGLIFKELLDVLKTEFIAKRFAITVENSHGKYSGKLEDMEMRNPNFTEQNLQEVLSEDSCRWLLSFIRLWKVTGWTLNDVDGVLVTLSDTRLAGSPMTQNYSIDPDMITGMAAVKKLSEMTNIEIQRLLPLWNVMRRDGLDPLYKRLFCQPKMLQRYPKLDLDKAEENGQDQKPLKILEMMIPLLAALEIPSSEFPALTRITGVTEQSDWTIENVSILYRFAMMCNMLDISTDQYQGWLVMNQDVADPFESPQITVDVVDRWISLKAGGWSGDFLAELASTHVLSNSLTDTNEAEVVELASQIIKAIVEFENQNPSPSADNSGTSASVTPERLLQICTQLFDAPIAETVAAMADGSWSTSITVPMTITKEQLSSLGSKATAKNKTLRINGVLKESERDLLINIAPSDEQWTTTIAQLYNTNRRPFELLMRRAPSNIMDKVPFLQDPVPEDKTKAEQVEETQSQRRTIFVQAFLSLVEASVTGTSIQALVAASKSSIRPQMLEKLLTEPQQSSGKSILAELQSLSRANSASLHHATSGQDLVEGYIIVPVTDVYHIYTKTKETTVILFENGVAHDYTAESMGTVKLMQGKCYKLSIFSSNASGFEDVQFAALAGSQFTLTANNFVHVDTLQVVASNLVRLDIASGVLKQASFSEAELSHFKIDGKINFFGPSLAGLHSLQAYIKARKTLQKNSKQPLVEWLQKLSQASAKDTSQDDLAETLHQITGWESGQILRLLQKWSANGNSLPCFDAKGLLLLQDTLDLARKIPVPLESLWYWCSLDLPKELTAAFHAVKSLDTIVSVRKDSKAIKAHQRVASTKRQKLVAFIMTKPVMGDSTKIVDEDTLFEYFLIDVQTGPQLQTSRIQQAISTVQLFVQRSLLGLEKKNGIPTTAVKRSTWNWMSKFTLWQANRKVFLYPENWIDPTLRTDKSQHFVSLEAEIIKSNLDKDTINALFRTYIYTTNEIADLEVQSYFWEAGTGFHGKYHLFARTRTSPYIYWYRYLEISGAQMDAPRYSWYPWSRLDVDIPAVETDWDGGYLSRAGTYMVPSIYRGRLFLLIPELALKTRPKGEVPDRTFQEHLGSNMRESQSKQYWELRMSWIENRNGVWSNKEISTSSIQVEGRDVPGVGEASKMPSVTSFQFRVSSRSPPGTENSEDNEILVIDAIRWVDGATNGAGHYAQLHVGRFELRKTQMVATDYHDSSIELKNTIPTRFSKLDHATDSTTLSDLRKELVPFGQYDPATQKELQPLVAVPEASLPELSSAPHQDLSWTVSYNEAQHNGASGLFVQRTTNSHADSWFGVPFRDNRGLFQGGNREVVSVQRVLHVVAQPMMEVAIGTDDLKSLFNVLEAVPFSMQNDAFGGAEPLVARELATPYSAYNWELGFHLVLLLMERLLSTQQFELALELANLVFDPRANDENLQRGEKSRFIALPNAVATGEDQKKPLSSLDRCWKFVPFKNSKLRLAGSLKSVVEKLSPGPKTSDDIDEWLANPFDPHSIARNRPSIYMKRFIIKYIEILVAAGDTYFRQESLESIPLALQRYVEASQLFGEHPQLLPQPTKPITKTYNDISAELNDFSSASVDMELEFPFFVEPSARAVQAGSQTYDSVLGVVRSSYFPVPPNPQIADLRDLIDDRFYKIRNSLDINGNFRVLPLFDPPLDPGQLVRAMFQGGMNAVLSQAIDGPMPTCRFTYLLQKAFEACDQLRRLAKAYLPIKEKRDTEALAALRSRQEYTMHSMMLEVRKLQRDEASKVLESLWELRSKHVMQLEYYLTLLGTNLDRIPYSNMDGKGKKWQDVPLDASKGDVDLEEGGVILSKEEKLMVDKLKESKKYSTASTIVAGVAALLAPTPEVRIEGMPAGVGGSTRFDAGKVSSGLKVVAAIAGAKASMSLSESTNAKRKHHFLTQAQERRLRANLAGHELNHVFHQMEIYKIRVDTAEASIKAQEQQVTHAKEIDDFLRTKYTNESLYAWMDAALRQLLYKTYLLAADAAKSAEKAFRFERRPLLGSSSLESYISASYWDDARDGAFAANGLYLDLKRLESARQMGRNHDFELTKNVSLRQIDPWALLLLQENGKTDFVIPEVLFDFDFPGHYCRRIHSVALTITTAADTEEGSQEQKDTCCTLQLLEHVYRLKQQQSGLPYYPADSIDTDPRYHSDKIPILSVALSNSRYDSGSFKVDFADSERYGPFEGAGVISRWRLELPTVVRAFDYGSIEDVTIHVKYTSLNGGVGWQKKAEEAVLAFQRATTAQLHTVHFNLRDRLLKSTDSKVVVSSIRRQLPFWTRSKTIAIRQCWLVGSKDVGLIGDGGADAMPTINGTATVDSRSQESDDSDITDAIGNLDELVEIVETPVDESRRGLVVGNDITIELKRKVTSDQENNELAETRLWLFVQFSAR